MLQKILWSGPNPIEDETWKERLSCDNKQEVIDCLKSLSSYLDQLMTHFEEFELENENKKNMFSFFQFNNLDQRIEEEKDEMFYQFEMHVVEPATSKSW